jgi:RNA polymerase sigma factor (sigma-70 family)
VLSQVHALFSVGTYRDLTDGQLLERFATEGGEAGELAFAALVERHGPMVLRVCRGILADPHDSQDAFQATFLVLVQKARALWVRESIGPWLHQVACRTASCARSASARRRRLEHRADSPMPEGRVEVDDELFRTLHEEINRLPERYRAPVVLCDLEGRTREQAARHLGWPIGTIKSRLSRARVRLRDRLIRRGLAPGAVLPIVRTGMRTPAALAESTARVALQFVSSPAMVQEPAALLAQGALRAMVMTRWMKAASLLLVLGAAVSGAGFLTRGASGVGPQQGVVPAAERRDDTPVFEVRPGLLRVEVVERGTVESPPDRVVYNDVEDLTTVISTLPEGTRVRRGDLVCELDSSRLRDRLIGQGITLKKARGDLEEARTERDAAEAELRAFEQISFPLQDEAIEGRIAVAEAELALAQRRAEKVERGADVDDLAKGEAQLAVKRAEHALRQAKGELRLLRDVTRVKELHGVRTQVKRAESHVLAREAASQLEEAREAKLNKQIEKCKVYAPVEGFVSYVNPPIGANQEMIEEGAAVRERQKLFSVFDPTGRILVNTKVHETVVDRLSRGLRARIKVDAIPDRVLSGMVKVVAPLPDVGRSPAQPVKLYTTLVELDEGLPGLRPGMSAEVEILVTELDHVLSVPVQSVLAHEGKYKVAVKQLDGEFAWREVTLGMTNDKFVEVKQGIMRGDNVARDPASLLGEGEKHQGHPDGPKKPAVSKEGDPRTGPRLDR